MQNNKVKIFIVGILVYLLSAGLSYASLSFFVGDSGKITLESPEPAFDEKGQLIIKPTEPKTEICPLNGKLYTKTEKKVWDKRRPLAVMIENHVDSRPQSGLSFADIVYETVAEGGITRFMGVFYCNAVANNIQLAPVRSARTYFVDWVSEYDALYNHVGGAGRCNDPTVDDRAKALCQIGQYKIKDLDQFGISYPTCFRNPDRTGKTVATEHQMICISDKLYEVAEDRGWGNPDEDGSDWQENFREWQFTDKENPAQNPEALSISFGFWEGYKEFNVQWDYDQKTNSYKRTMGGEVHIDFETKEPIMTKNVVIQFAKETGPVDEHKHLLYKTIDEGKALIFNNGQVEEGTWEKSKRTARTLYFDSQGEEINFVPGQIWIEVLPTGNDVKY